MTDIAIETFGNQYKDMSFADIIHTIDKKDKTEAIDLFFMEMIKQGADIEYAETEFLKTAEKIIASIIDNSIHIDKELLLYLGRITNGLKNDEGSLL